MLTVFVFDEQESRRAEDLPETLKGLDDGAMVWIALRDPSEEEVAAVQEALSLDGEQARRLLEQPSQASLVEHGEHLHVTLYAASSEEGEPVLRPLECVLGPNWVVTLLESPKLGGIPSRTARMRSSEAPEHSRCNPSRSSSETRSKARQTQRWCLLVSFPECRG